MRKGVLAALTALLVSQGLAFALQFGPSPEGDLDTQVETGGVWGSGEYLLWWLKNGRVPPLVTAGGDGKLGSPGVRPLVDTLGFDDDARSGGRFALGYDFEADPAVGVAATYFFLAGRRSDISYSSGGDPPLAQPFIDAVTGHPDANQVAVPGAVSGTVTVAARTSLWGAEANLSAGLVRSDNFRLTALGGFRFLRLEDEVTSTEQFLVSPSLPQFGGGNRAILGDGFRTDNRFFGGQLGAEAGAQLGLLTIDFRGKLGLGQMQQVGHVNGTTTKLAPDGSRTIFQGGLYALRSNIGRHQRDELAFVPEAGVNAGLLVTPRCKVYAGYSFLWVSTVARAGEQIDPVVNVSQFPIRSANGPLVGPARPAFPFNGNDFLAQGLSFGLELRY
ncbi:MAG: BBP7 family outer membrane beta-barrel protein [Gemmataceae bacterium]